MSILSFTSLEIVAVFVRIFIISAFIALIVGSWRLYLAIKGIEVKAVKPYVDVAKYLFIFAIIVCLDQVIELLELLHNVGFVTLLLSMSIINIARAFMDALLVVGLVPLIITLFRSHYLLVYRQS